MPTPRKSTLDAWLDQFAGWSSEDRGFALGQLQAIHRALAVAERRAPQAERQRQETPNPQRGDGAKCDDCAWVGSMADLVTTEGGVTHCPKCNSISILENLEVQQ